MDPDKDWKMSCSALSLTLGILSSLVFPDVSTDKLPHAGNINTITRRIFLKVSKSLHRLHKKGIKSTQVGQAVCILDSVVVGILQQGFKDKNLSLKFVIYFFLSFLLIE